MLVSSALLIYQISFTRLIGYRLFYHFVFLAIAITLLGLGAAGTYVAVRPPKDLDRRVHGALLALLVLIPVSFLMMANPLPISHAGIALKLIGWPAVQYLLWCSLFMLLLNFLGGVVLASIFCRFSEQMGRLYARDLFGAGLGCLLALVAMKYGSPPIAFLSSSVLILAAWVPFHRVVPGAGKRAFGYLAALGALALCAWVILGPASLRSFDGFAIVNERHPIKGVWNHLIRTEHHPGEYVLDGDANTPTVVWSDEARSQPVTDPAYLLSRSHPTVAVIGSGGGPQIAEALRADASKIFAVEINPTIVRWVMNEDRELNGGLFADPRIQLVAGEGRHAVRQSGQRFDVIAIHAIDTYAATVAGAYSLTENFLYTKEAFEDYLAVMSDDGLLTIRRWLFNPPRENLRLFITALDALEEMKVREPEKHVVMLAPVPDFEILRTEQRRDWGFLMVSRSPFSSERVAKLEEQVKALGWSILYAPGVASNTPFSAYIAATDRAAFQASYPYFVAPVTDSSPYLFQFYNPFRAISYRPEGDWAVSGVYQSSSVSLLVSFAASLVLSLLTILLPLEWIRRRDRRAGMSAAPGIGGPDMVYFACLGVGFMAVEVPLVQILSLYLGHPTYGLSVVLVALLLSTGAGSLLADRVPISRGRICALVAAILFVLTASIFPLVHGTIQLPDAARFVLALLVLTACGLPMGFPLALAVRELGRSDSRSVAWAWAINGSASVVGSTIVMMVMVYLGTHAALALGVGSYAVAALTRAWAAASSPGAVRPMPGAAGAPADACPRGPNA